MPTRLPFFLIVLTAALALLTPRAALAQDTGLKITLDKFGVGNQARLGDTAGIRLVLNDSSPSNRTVLVRLSRRDPDGDTIESERVVTTNPGIQQGVWFYVRVPYDFNPGSAATGFVATAFEAEERESPGEGQSLFTAGRVLARLSLEPKSGSILARTIGLIGTTGSATMGLREYGLTNQQSMDPWFPGRGEATELVQGIRVEDMPDQWLGWSSFETLVWTSGEPSELKGERARAVREWVQRGGHLIIVMPSVGQTWTNRQSNELFSILPTASIQRKEGVDLEPYRPMLKGIDRKRKLDDNGNPVVDINGNQVFDRFPLPPKAVVHTFTPMPDGGIGGAIRILNGPDGECVVVRRLVGSGCVTLVGIDMLAAGLSTGSSIDPVAFWHRILGKRGRFPTQTELDEARRGGTTTSVAMLDMGISRELNARQEGRSARGLLLGLILFIVYWLVAGPVGFAILKRRRLTAHAWVGFFATAVAFTAIAWAGATAMRPKQITVSHLTLLDHVYGQPFERSRTWASVLLPGYGNATIRAGEPDATSAATSTWDFVSPWETSDDNAARANFLDSRAYRVDARTPDSMRVPTRATVKEIVADWAGGPVWKMPFPEVLPDGSESRIEWKNLGAGLGTIVTGILKHELPGTLRNVNIIVMRGQDDFSPSGNSPRDTWFSRATAIKTVEEWPADEALDLELLQAGQDNRRPITTFLTNLVPAAPRMSMGWGATTEPEEPPQSRMMSAMFTPLLPAPDLSPLLGSSTVALRSATHGWDLARWLTHPCIIIIGELDGESPTPIFVDGERVVSKGKTFVRWIYPMPDAPPAYQKGLGPATADPATPVEGEPQPPQ